MFYSIERRYEEYRRVDAVHLEELDIESKSFYANLNMRLIPSYILSRLKLRYLHFLHKHSFWKPKIEKNRNRKILNENGAN